MQTKDQPKRGRPPDYGAEIADTICNRLAGGESLRAICADAGMPNRATVSRWLARYEEFRDLYEFARECQAECLVDEILKIARDSSRDYVKKTGVDGKVTRVVDREHSQIGISTAMVTLSFASMKRCSVSCRMRLSPTAGRTSAAGELVDPLPAVLSRAMPP
jgi:hypothetical protein